MNFEDSSNNSENLKMKTKNKPTKKTFSQDTDTYSCQISLSWMLLLPNPSKQAQCFEGWTWKKSSASVFQMVHLLKCSKNADFFFKTTQKSRKLHLFSRFVCVSHINWRPAALKWISFVFLLYYVLDYKWKDHVALVTVSIEISARVLMSYVISISSYTVEK